MWIFIPLGIGFLYLAALCLVFSMTYSVNREKAADPTLIPSFLRKYGQDRQLQALTAEVMKLPYEEVYTTSFDGLKLCAHLYRVEDPEAPWQILAHGYRGSSLRDVNGAIVTALRQGRNVLSIDQRGHGKSGGICLTFGILERKDVLSWIQFLESNYGKERKILLNGISMGAATVLMAAAEAPESVVGVIADCGYSDVKEMLCTELRRRKLPVKPVYALMRQGAVLFGRFDPEAYSPMEAVKNIRIPVYIIHGEADDFVPYDMGRRLFESCASEKKRMLSVPGGGTRALLFGG